MHCRLLVAECQTVSKTTLNSSQTNIVIKHQLLVNALVKSGDFETALSSIEEFVKFLFASVIDASQTAEEIIQDQIEVWVNTKELSKQSERMSDNQSSLR